MLLMDISTLLPLWKPGHSGHIWEHGGAAGQAGMYQLPDFCIGDAWQLCLQENLPCGEGSFKQCPKALTSWKGFSLCFVFLFSRSDLKQRSG